MNIAGKPERDWRPTRVVQTMIFVELYDAMTANEFIVLSYVYARTRLYGKEWEAIPKRHFLQGVYKDGITVIPPCKVRNEALWSCLHSLQGKGLLEVRKRATNSNEYRVIEEPDLDKVYEYILKNQADLIVQGRILRATKAASMTGSRQVFVIKPLPRITKQG